MRRSICIATLVLACGFSFPTKSTAQDVQRISAPSARQEMEVATRPPFVARDESPGESAESIGREESRESNREGDEIETDRDSFTPATSTVGRRRFILESAYTFFDNRGLKETHSFPELLLRYGASDRLELRLGWNYEIGGSELPGAEAGEDPSTEHRRLLNEHVLSYGLKYGLTAQSGWLPRSAFILQGVTPTGGSDGTPTATNMVVTYATGWELPNRWRFDAAMRYGTESEEGDRFNNWAPSAVLRVPIGERWAVHGEYFGVFTTGKEANAKRQYFSPGVHYLVTPDLEVGVRLGWSLNDQPDRFFSNLGFGWRF